MIQKYLANATDRVTQIVHTAIGEVARQGVNILMPEHVLSSLIESNDEVLTELTADMGFDFEKFKVGALQTVQDQFPRTGRGRDRISPQETIMRDPQGIYVSEETLALFERADFERREIGDSYIGVESLILAFFDKRIGPARKALTDAGFDYDAVKKMIVESRSGRRLFSRSDDARGSFLKRFTRDLTALAKTGKLDPVSGRDKETSRVIEILARRKKNNPVLIGEPGVGKTVIVEGLAQRIVAGNVPKSLRRKKVLSLEMSDIVAGSKLHGEFEERLKQLKDEIAAFHGEVILFIDEMHTIVGAGRTAGALDASNIFKAALANGSLQCIGATTLAEYKKYIEADRALERRFQSVLVEEPSPEEARHILQMLAPRYEKHHGVRYSPESLDAAVSLSSRYIQGRSLPDKAIDLMDEAGSAKRVEIDKDLPDVEGLSLRKAEKEREKSRFFDAHDFAKASAVHMEILGIEREINTLQKKVQEQEASTHITSEDIASIVARSTGIPVGRLQAGDLEKLMDVENELAHRVVGQKHAIEAVSDALRRNRVGLRERRAPIGSFLFLGPTGVGKTELAKALAEFVLDDENRIIRVDMSEYMERHEAAKLIGSPPGYVGYGEGGQLTEKVRRHPYSVVLFDEIEKAHPDIFNMLLQVLDDGRLTDAEGRTVSFENTIIIFTSNIGSEYLAGKGGKSIGLGANETDQSTEAESRVRDELRRYFRPEFLNRLDDVIIFKTLSRDECRAVLDLQLSHLRSRLAKMGMGLELDGESIEYLLEKGFDPIYGARPLRRTIERDIESKIATEVIRVGKMNLSGKLEGSSVVIRRDDSAFPKLNVSVERPRNLEVHVAS